MSEWRIPKLPREEWTDAAREVFAFWGEPNSWEEGSKTNIIMTWANHPPLGMAYNIFGKHFLVTNTLDPRDRELVVMRVAWLVKSEYEWHNHVGYCLNLDMSLEEIAAIKDGPDSAFPFSDKDRAIMRGCDELILSNDLSDATWTELSRHLTRQQIMDYTVMIGHYVMTSWAITAWRMPLEEHADKIGWDLKTASGKTPTRTYKPGETEDWADNRGYSE